MHAFMYEYACLLASRNVCMYAQYRDIETCGLTLHKEERGKNYSKKCESSNKPCCFSMNVLSTLFIVKRSCNAVAASL